MNSSILLTRLSVEKIFFMKQYHIGIFKSMVLGMLFLRMICKKFLENCKYNDEFIQHEKTMPARQNHCRFREKKSDSLRISRKFI